METVLLILGVLVVAALIAATAYPRREDPSWKPPADVYYCPQCWREVKIIYPGHTYTACDACWTMIVPVKKKDIRRARH